MSSPAYQSPRARRVLGLVAAAMLLGGCAGLLENALIDGWPVGQEETCPEPNAPPGQLPEHWDCQAALALWLTTASEGFDRRDPGHPVIIRASLHDEGAMRDAAGNQVLMTRSGGAPRVAVFELADGSVRAIGITHPGVDTEHLLVIDHGP